MLLNMQKRLISFVKGKTEISPNISGGGNDRRQPIAMLFQLTRKYLGIETGALIAGVLCLVIALISLSRLQETFHKDMDYFEEFI